MTKKLHLIYIPGLGDNNPNGQRRAVKTWRWWGVEAELFQVKWADNEPWALKFDRLLQRIDDLVAEGRTVAIAGSSAGGSAVINAYAARKDVLAGAVIIAGKVNHPEAIGGRYRSNNPSFVTSAQDCKISLSNLNDADRRRILSRYAYADEIVHKKDSIIPGAHNQMVPIIGHVPVIATQITFGAPSFIRFLKQQAKQRSK